MSIEVTRGHDDSRTIRIVGRLDFQAHEDFRRAYEACPEGTRFAVDLSDTEYVDSSGLGMLLLLRRHAGDTDEAVALTGARPQVLRILSIAKFDRLFRIA